MNFNQTRFRVKSFASSVNSELRRRISHDLGSGQNSASSVRSKPGQILSANESSGRDRLTTLLSRRKKDNESSIIIPLISFNTVAHFSSASDDSPSAARKPLLNVATGAPACPDAPASSQAHSTIEPPSEEDNPWSAKRRATDTLLSRRPVMERSPESERELERARRVGSLLQERPDANGLHTPVTPLHTVQASLMHAMSALDIQPTISDSLAITLSLDGIPPGLSIDPSNLQWSYLDPTGQVQGNF